MMSEWDKRLTTALSFGSKMLPEFESEVATLARATVEESASTSAVWKNRYEYSTSVSRYLPNLCRSSNLPSCVVVKLISRWCDLQKERDCELVFEVQGE
jgi:protoporphyrinogen oxidase